MPTDNCITLDQEEVITSPPLGVDKGKKRGLLSKKWTFTINNYKLDHMDHFLEVLKGGCPTLVAGKEIGESGKPHIQGYLDTD